MNTFIRIRSALSSIGRFVGKAFTPPSEEAAMHRYLSEATDIYDLEARQRAWDKRDAHIERNRRH